MPYVADVYQLPPGTAGTPNTTIESAKYNTFIADIATAQNTPRPVLGGGTGGQTAVDGNDGLNTQGADIASGSTTDLSAATGVYVRITGTTTINSFGTVGAGALRQVTFTGILTLTYNATSMILPGAANITTAAGDTATFRSLGGGNWRCVDYLRASGQSVTNVIVSPNITGATTITNTAAGNILTMTSTDAGSGAVVAELYKDSASPAASDFLGQLNIAGRNSAATKISYASLTAQITDPTAASEDSLAYITTYVAGVNAARLLITDVVTAPGGFYVGSARVGGVPDVILEEQQVSGTDGGTFTSGAWRTRVLNTEARDPAGLCTLAGNAFTFTVAGYVKWRAPALHVNQTQTRLFNVTDTAVVKSGSTASTDSGNFVQVDSVGWAAVVAGKQYRLEHQCTTTQSTTGFGRSAGFGETEVYSQVEFWRTA